MRTDGWACVCTWQGVVCNINFVRYGAAPSHEPLRRAVLTERILWIPKHEGMFQLMRCAGLTKMACHLWKPAGT